MPPSTCNIRQAQAHEAQLLSELAIRSKAYWGYSKQFMQACRAELTYLAEDIQNGSFYVAEVDGVITGFYALKPLSSSEVELEAMFVDPIHIGQGHGRALIEHAKAQMVEVGYAMMIIQADPSAQDFYRAAGGRLTGQRESDSIPGRYLPTYIIQV